MVQRLWLKNETLLVDAQGHPILCNDCPCDGEAPPIACGGCGEIIHPTWRCNLGTITNNSYMNCGVFSGTHEITVAPVDFSTCNGFLALGDNESISITFNTNYPTTPAKIVNVILSVIYDIHVTPYVNVGYPSAVYDCEEFNGDAPIPMVLFSADPACLGWPAGLDLEPA